MLVTPSWLMICSIGSAPGRSSRTGMSRAGRPLTCTTTSIGASAPWNTWGGSAFTETIATSGGASRAPSAIGHQELPGDLRACPGIDRLAERIMPRLLLLAGGVAGQPDRAAAGLVGLDPGVELLRLDAAELQRPGQPQLLQRRPLRVGGGH